MDKPWYHEGLRFACTECGKCCTGSPGYVWIEEKEVEELAKQKDLSIQEFKKRYTRMAHGRLCLTEKRVDPENYACVFLQGNKCTVYQNRPKQCRTFPWWKENLQSPSSWEVTAKECEGINSAGAKLFSCEEIEKFL